jgi:hypothetical protein
MVVEQLFRKVREALELIGRVAGRIAGATQKRCYS